MKREEKTFLPMNLQFFASEGGEGEGSEEGTATSEGSNVEGKTFTQEQLTAMMTKEKKEGRRAVLSSLGVKSEKELKDLVDLARQTLESSLSDDEKNDKKNKELEDSISEAERRAMEAENKLACVLAGVDKDSIDDVIAIAKQRMTDDKKLEVVLGEMKKEPKYNGFFKTNTDDASGTGSDPDHLKRDSNKKDSIGKRLAENQKRNASKKSSYF